VYPNPSRGKVRVGYQLAAKSQATVSVFNIEGRIVKQINFTSANAPSGNIDMDVSDLSNGTYFVKIKSGNQSVTQKLIIEK